MSKMAKIISKQALGWTRAVLDAQSIPIGEYLEARQVLIYQGKNIDLEPFSTLGYELASKLLELREFLAPDKIPTVKGLESYISDFTKKLADIESKKKYEDSNANKAIIPLVIILMPFLYETLNFKHIKEYEAFAKKHFKGDELNEKLADAYYTRGANPTEERGTLPISAEERKENLMLSLTYSKNIASHNNTSEAVLIHTYFQLFRHTEDPMERLEYFAKAYALNSRDAELAEEAAVNYIGQLLFVNSVDFALMQSILPKILNINIKNIFKIILDERFCKQSPDDLSKQINDEDLVSYIDSIIVKSRAEVLSYTEYFIALKYYTVLFDIGIKQIHDNEQITRAYNNLKYLHSINCPTLDSGLMEDFLINILSYCQKHLDIPFANFFIPREIEQILKSKNITLKIEALTLLNDNNAGLIYAIRDSILKQMPDLNEPMPAEELKPSDATLANQNDTIAADHRPEETPQFSASNISLPAKKRKFTAFDAEEVENADPSTLTPEKVAEYWSYKKKVKASYQNNTGQTEEKSISWQVENSRYVFSDASKNEIVHIEHQLYAVIPTHTIEALDATTAARFSNALKNGFASRKYGVNGIKDLGGVIELKIHDDVRLYTQTINTNPKGDSLLVFSEIGNHEDIQRMVRADKVIQVRDVEYAGDYVFDMETITLGNDYQNPEEIPGNVKIADDEQ